MQIEQIFCVVLIVCTSCLSVASDQHWNSDQQSTETQNKPKFSDFRDLKIHETDEKVSKINESESNKAHSRQKRLIWITDDGRLALPPGTALTITPTLALPFVRYPPDGFFSNISVSLPVTCT